MFSTDNKRHLYEVKCPSFLSGGCLSFSLLQRTVGNITIPEWEERMEHGNWKCRLEPSHARTCPEPSSGAPRWRWCVQGGVMGREVWWRQ